MTAKAYMYLFPQSKVKVLLGQSITQVPALLVIGFWFFVQFVSQIGVLASTQGDADGGVAYMAHIGGFIAGLGLAVILSKFKP